jgi:hypothetical protein
LESENERMEYLMFAMISGVFERPDCERILGLEND